MTKPAARIFPLGENALTVELGDTISEEINRRAIRLAEYFEKSPFPGFVEAVPAYASTTVFYDLHIVRHGFAEANTAFAAVKALCENALTKLTDSKPDEERSIRIPVSFDEESALDLDEIAKTKKLTPDEVIEIFTSKEYRVYMLGFLPGFAYMGEVDERIATPRKETPRVKVPKGSVGIAGSQTGIYSLESPGGWQIIGRTDFELFTPDADGPCLLRAGDRINFYRA
jgi:inhibitor of KinA